LRGQRSETVSSPLCLPLAQASISLQASNLGKARVFRTKITSTAVDAGLAKILSLSCKVLDYRDGRVLSSGVPVRDLSDFPFWPTA
jgi:formyltetrahydrofolate synthetase